MLRKLLTVSAILLLTACAQVGPFRPKAGIKLYTMDCGHFHLADAASFADNGAYKGQVRDLVNPCFLIRHPTRGDMMWDTGVPSATINIPPRKNAAGEVYKAPTMEAQLAQIGLKPADIRYVSFSHSHFDHAGNGSTFAASTWLVQKAERDWMFRPDARKSRDFPDWAKLENAKTVVIEGGRDYDVFGDGSAVIVSAPGHTPGHSVLLLKFAHHGNLILAGDMWHMAEARERRTVPVFNVDKAQTLKSMDKVEALAKARHARVIRQHVTEDFVSLPQFPAALD